MDKKRYRVADGLLEFLGRRVPEDRVVELTEEEAETPLRRRAITLVQTATVRKSSAKTEAKAE